MSVLGANVLTLADWAKRLDPDGKVPEIVEMLSQTNEILLDMQWKEGNLPTGDRTTIRTGLPTVAWRLINQGVQPSKSTTAQVDEACGLMEAWSEVDKELAILNGNTSAFRLSEGAAYVEAMNQEMAATLIYGNSSTAPEEFTGLAARYSSLSAANGQNIVDAGGTDSSDSCSIWLICWGPSTIHGIFPKGTKAGLEHFDHGEVTVETTAGIAGTRMRAFQDQWTWKCGVALRDWRYVVRIANIDKSALVAETANADLTKQMTKALWRLPSRGMGKCAFYMNRTVGEFLDIQRQIAVKAGGQLGYENVDGKFVPSFRGIPLRTLDCLLETESRVT